MENFPFQKVQTRVFMPQGLLLLASGFPAELRSAPPTIAGGLLLLPSHISKKE